MTYVKWVGRGAVIVLETMPRGIVRYADNNFQKSVTIVL